MKTTKHLTAILAATLCLTALAGCGSSQPLPGSEDNPEESISTGWYRTPDGHKVMCVVITRTGVSCDWERRS